MISVVPLGLWRIAFRSDFDESVYTIDDRYFGYHLPTAPMKPLALFVEVEVAQGYKCVQATSMFDMSNCSRVDGRKFDPVTVVLDE